MGKTHKFDPKASASEVMKRRRAVPVVPGLFQVIGRNGRTRYDVTVGEGYDLECTCPAGIHGKPCYHAAVTARYLTRKGMFA